MDKLDFSAADVKSGLEDEIDAKKEGLLAATEEKLKQRVSREELFTIRWQLV